MSTSEFQTMEPITAVLHVSVGGGEAYSGPIIFGYYTNGAGESWIEQEGKRIHIPAEHFKDFMKQAKRAHVMASQDTSGDGVSDEQ